MATAQNQTQAAFLNNLLATNIAGATAGQLQGYGNQAIGALGTGYGQARTDVTGQFQPSLDALGQGYGQGRSDLIAGNAAAGGDIRTGIAGYQPYIDTGASANSMYGNALGLNGAGGNAAATGAFQASPGYAWNRDQAIDASARKMNALGIGGSGNTLDAITRLGENLANNEYSNWLSNLNTAAGRGLTAASGAASGYSTLGGLDAALGTGEAGLDTGLGTATAGLRTNFGTTLGNLGTGLGTGEASVYTGLGNSLAGVNQNLMTTLGQNNTNAGQAQDAANNANSNRTLGLLGLGVRGAGSLLGGSDILGSLGSGFGRLFGGSTAASAPF